MDTIVVVTEANQKQCIREVLLESLESIKLDFQQQETIEPLLSREEIAEYLQKITLVTLHAWMKEGLPSHKMGGRTYFLKSEVLEFIKSR